AKAGKGEVSIRLDASPSGNRLTVRDTGDGIPPDMLPHIFRRFYTSTGHDDSVLGAGIGLAFCRDVMTSFGGTIECTSVHGDFTEFVLSFPRS
ncbi:MAG: sensor histidine kinase, partial [Sterolibacteriaceae bacterium]|nr:sensor histidine kinase [Sterolibacteriaceae bacterium]